MVPLILAILGLIVSYLYGPVHWTIDFLYRSIVMVILSYSVAFVGALIINTLRVPWLLDAESGQQIDALETRALLAESKADDDAATKRENKRLHDLFGEFMVEGELLTKELGRTHGDKFGAWLQKRRTWEEKICQTLIEMSLSTEAAAFRHAGEKDPKVAPGTVVDDRYWYQLYGEQINGCRTKLQDIVMRRLP
jgi:hypothetical protein